ncbi:discoidin domain-containing protein [Gelidibacter mesophilus]|uniref:discoidin domain-containing protein n=1 Tax=Gelidibacter mesophilus TaxID=169050 RepID=UPI000422445F|nr:discoidin domain-containing protein [Gelidibacter mesophilus]
MKQKLPVIFSLIFLLGLNGFSKNLEELDIWSTPVSVELEAVALLSLTDAKLYVSNLSTSSVIEKALLSFDEIDTYVSPACPEEGQSCDDGDSNTVNDALDADCNCVGVARALSCEDVEIAYQINDGIRVNDATTVTVGEGDKIALFSNLENYTVSGPGGIVPGNTINNIGTSQAGVYTVNGTYRSALPMAAPILHYVSSQETVAETAPATNAFDGSNSTFWHSQYSNDPDAPYPHEIQIDMGAGSVLSGFTYLPRQGNANGRIAGYEIYVSNSTTDWGAPVAQGVVGGTGVNALWENNEDRKTVSFPAKQGRYLRFVATRPANSTHPWATAADLTVIRATGVTATASSSQAINPPSYAIDNNDGTFWHSRYTGTPQTAYPHYITLDLGVSSNVSALEYLPRQDANSNGRILNYEIYVGNSIAELDAATTPLTSGTWTYTGTAAQQRVLKTVNFTETSGRYVRLSATLAVTDSNDGWTFASAARVRAVRTSINVPCSKTIAINVDPIVTYTYTDGAWAPETPIGTATANDIINIASGNAVISNDMNCNALTVSPGASLTVDPGVILTTNTTALESTSLTYSSLILNGTLEGEVSYSRYTNVVGTLGAGGGNDLISAPLSGVVFGPFATANTGLLAASGVARAFAPYNTNAGEYQNYNITDNVATTITSGAGFRAAATNGNNLIFTGTVAKTNVDVPILDVGLGKAWNLIGNPYPSYLDFDTFFTANLDELRAGEAYQAIYGYKGNTGDWNIVNNATSSEFPLIAPGQGFFVKAKIGGGSIQFTPAMRRVGDSDDYIVGRSSNSNKAFSKLKLISASRAVSTSIYFIEGTTRGLDPGYDAAAYAATPVDFSIFTNLLEDGDGSGLDIAIQSLPYNDFNDVTVPLGIKAKANTELIISVDDLSTIPSHINVYLEDVQNKTLTLLNNDVFRFTPSIDVNSSELFNVHYSARTLSIGDMQFSDDLRIYTTTSPKTLFIKGQLTKATTANLYDIQGRLVLSKVLNPNSTENTMDISTVSTGVYVVKVNSDNQVKKQKVLIK